MHNRFDINKSIAESYLRQRDIRIENRVSGVRDSMQRDLDKLSQLTFVTQEQADELRRMLDL